MRPRRAGTVEVLAADASQVRRGGEIKLGLDADLDRTLGSVEAFANHLRIEQRAGMQRVDRDLAGIEPAG